MKGSALFPLLTAALTPFLVLVLIVTATGFGLVAWKPPVIWSHTFAVSGADNGATVVASDSSNAYVQGYLNSSGFGYGSGSLFLNKYDTGGGLVWNRTIGNTNDSSIDAMSVGTDGVYLTGGVLSSGIVLKYDFAGNRIWANQFGRTDSSQGKAISVSPSGVYVTGTSSPLTNQSYTGLVSFVREYDFTGKVVWTNEFYNGTGFIGGVYASASGVYISWYSVGRIGTQSGGFLAKYDSSGNLLWNRQLLGAGSKISGDSTGFYLLGPLNKYDFDGNPIWAAQDTSPPDLSAVADSSITASPSGIYVSITTVPGHDFVMKYDLSGNHVWTLQMPQTHRNSEAATSTYSLAPGPGGVYFAASLVEPDSSNAAFLGEVSASASLVFFGINPPLSFGILGGLIGTSAVSLFFFRRLRRGKVRPHRVGQTPRSLPTSD